MAKNKTRYTALTAQYAEKPSPVFDEATLASVPVSSANQKRFETLSEGDDKPFEFIQEIKFGDKYPATDETIFDKEWAESFSDKSNKVVIPGSAYGHTSLGAWMERVRNHVYVIAGKVEGDSLLLRHYVSNKMDKNDYDALISEIKAGLISTSVVSQYEYKTVVGKDGKVTYHATKSVGRERNDLVEWDQTGMVSKMIATSQKDGVNIENDGEGESHMNYEELVAAFKELLAKSPLDHTAVAKDLGLNLEILTAAQKEDLAFASKVREVAAGADVLQVVSDAITAQSESFGTLRDAAVEAAFGKDPELKKSAAGLFSLKTGSQKDIDAEIDRIKGLDAIILLAAKNADGRQKMSGSSGEKTAGYKIGSSFKEGK